jgi:hypothetical protein
MDGAAIVPYSDARPCINGPAMHYRAGFITPELIAPTIEG